MKHLQIVAALVLIVVVGAAWWLVAAISEKPAGPSYTPTGCAEGDRACQEWIDIQGPEESAR